MFIMFTMNRGLKAARRNTNFFSDIKNTQTWNNESKGFCFPRYFSSLADMLL